MILPLSLQPTTTEEVLLPSGRIVTVPKTAPIFPTWRGKPVNDTYNGKAILDYAGRPAFAELFILWTLMNEGWQGFWIDSYRHLYRTGYWDDEPNKSLPPKPDLLSIEIWNLAKSRSGAWDVFCWQDDEVLFVESKRAKRDHMRQTQLKFLESALSIGISPDSFLLVEWQLDQI